MAAAAAVEATPEATPEAQNPSVRLAVTERKLHETELMVRLLVIVTRERPQRWRANVYRYQGQLLGRCEMKSDEDWSWGRAWLQRQADGTIEQPHDHMDLNERFEKTFMDWEEVQSL